MQQTALQILVVEDNLGDFTLVREYLEEAFRKATVYHADTLQKGIALLERESIDVILLDLTLPDGMGIDSFHSINSKFPQVPVIILTGAGDTEIALESLKDGAQDFIIKDDSSPAVLAKSIKYGIERSKIYEHLKKSEEQYKLLFNNNPLPMFAYDTKVHTILMVNEAAIEHYGYSEEEFLKMTINELRPSNEEKNSSSYNNASDKETSTPVIDFQHQKRTVK